MKIIGLPFGHPIPTVYQRSLYHFKLFTRNHSKPRVQIFDDKILQFSIGKANYCCNNIVIAIWCSILNDGYILSPRYSLAVG